VAEKNKVADTRHHTPSKLYSNPKNT